MQAARLLRSSILVLALALSGATAQAATLAERAAAIDAPVRGNSTLKTKRDGESLEISLPLESAVVWGWGLELQRQKGSVAEGDRAGTELLRGFLKRHRYGHTSTRDLVQELNGLTGGNWQPWFEKYVYGTEIPRLPKP
jgi:hypothetical protein